MNISVQLPEVKLGIVEADDAGGPCADPSLGDLMNETCERKRREFTVETLASAEPVRVVRAMFRAWEMDPSKYRPSSESLLRRVVQGKGLYRVSDVVDIGNLGSIETGWPYGYYDRSMIRPPVVFRLGVASEAYEGIGKRAWHLEGRPVLADSEGPFGSPISDSTRTMIMGSARDVLMVIYAPSMASDTLVEAAMARLSERLHRFAGASGVRSCICR